MIDTTTTARDETAPAVDETTMDDDETTTSESSTPVDPCSSAQSFIDANFQTNLIDVSSIAELFGIPAISYNITFIDQTVVGFLQLFGNAPSVFGDFADALSNLTNQIAQLKFDLVGVDFPELPSNLTLMAILNESCGIELSDAQLSSTNNFFDVALPVSVFAQRGCALLNETFLEEAIFAANSTDQQTAPLITFLVMELSSSIGIDTFLIGLGLITDLLSTNPTDNAELVAQTLFDSFVATFNDFCGIPSLSSQALDALNDLLFRDAMQAINSS